VKRLAQIAYSDLPVQHQEHYTYDTFVQSLNDLGLHHQLRARGVITVEEALQEGEAYLLATQLHKGHRGHQPDAINATEGLMEPLPLTQAVSTPSSSPLNAEVNRMTEMLEQLVTVLASSNSTKSAQKPTRSPMEPMALCWGCGNRGHFRIECPQNRRSLNYHGPGTPSSRAG